MKLIKDKITVELNDDFVIDIYKNSGWEEIKETPKKVETKDNQNKK